jgi:hypothetical protein
MTEEDTIRHYACDGCMRMFWIRDSKIDSIDPDDWCPCGKFFGWILVGGKAWEMFMQDGIHPRTLFVQGIRKAYTDFVLKGIEGATKEKDKDA